MNALARRPGLRWLVPLVAALVLAVGASTVGVLTAAARSGLPHRSASQLLVDVQKAKLDGLSGTIVQNADLGLPSLPGVGGSGSSDLSSLVAGSHTLRIWYAGPEHVRLALQGSLGESDVVRSGTDLWTWSSTTKSATHHTVPASGDHVPGSLAAASAVTPQQAAEGALAAISPTTKVSTDGTAVVAGRSAYQLLLEPRDKGSLLTSIRIAIDGRSHMPTRVQVFGPNTTKPAFEVGFTSLSTSRPDASMFRFNPPPGTKVTRSPKSAVSPFGAFSARDGATSLAGPRPRVVGKGWTSVVVARVASPAGARPGTPTAMLRMLPEVSGSWGRGHLLRGRVFSALLTDDGRVAVGAVPPGALYKALAH
jgi:outer membrane lipoprotein-sorting protein